MVVLFLLPLCCSNRKVDVDLSGKWDLIVSDIDNFDNPNYAVKTLECSLPGDGKWLLFETSEFAAHVWLVKKVVIPESLKNKSLMLSLGRIALSDRCFFNGVEIGATGYMPQKDNPLGYGFALKYCRNYFIPANIIRFNETNIIEAQVFSHIYSGFADSPFIASQYNWEKQFRITDYMPILQNLGVIIVNIILFILIAHLREKRKRFPFIIYPLLLVIVSSGIHLLVMGYPFFCNGLMRFKLILISFVIGALCVYLMLVDFFYRRLKRVFWVFAAFSAMLIVLIAYAPDTDFFIFVSVPFFLVYAGLCIMYLFIPFAKRLFDIQLNNFYLYLMALPLVCIIINSAIHIFSLKVYRMPFLSFLFVPVILSNIIMYSIYDMKNTRGKNEIPANDNAEVVQQSTKSTQKEIIYQIQQHLDSNYRTGYNRLELAKQFNMHENYMVQLFKKTTGTTISNYVTSRRIMAAMRLIEKDEGRIIDIAYHVGFDNLTHFYRSFKKISGMTPNEYRSQQQRCPDE